MRNRDRASRTALGPENGAIVIQVAVALLAVTAFSALVIDYGVLMVSRAQVQTSADAGALAGAESFIVNNFTDRAQQGVVSSSAAAAAQQNLVWSASPAVQTATDISFYGTATNPAVPNKCLAPLNNQILPVGVSPPCIEVRAYRVQDHANPLPTYFAQLFGKSSQGVKASATAQAAPANATSCARPWALPDKWLEQPVPRLPVGCSDAPCAPDTFVATDLYTKPTATTPGTGYRVLGAQNNLFDYGARHRLIEKTVVPLTVDSFVPVSFAPKTFQQSILACSGIVTKIGDTLALDAAAAGNPAAAMAIARASATTLIGQDPNASYSVATNQITGSCASQNPPCAAFSPRIVVVPLVDVAAFTATGAITVRNFAGFFIEAVNAPSPAELQGSITGRLITAPGLMRAAPTPTVGHLSAFLRKAVLVR